MSDVLEGTFVRELTPAERHRVLVEFNDTARPYPQGLSLADLCDAQASRSPDAPAIAWESPSGELRSITYATLHERAGTLARRLRDHGIGPGIAVGICLERSAELVVAALAVVKSGGYYVPLDPEYPRERIAYMIADSKIRVLVTDARLRDLLEPAATTVLAGDDRPLEIPNAAAWPAPRPDDHAYMIYTSGSTGRPKGALNRHRGIVNRLQWMQERFVARPSDVFLLKTPFGFDISVWEIFWPLMSGAQLVLAKPGGQRDPEYLAELIRRRGVTIVHFVPSMLRLFASAEGVERCTSLRYVMASGEALPGDLVRDFCSRSNAELHNLYGPTETAIDVTHYACRRGIRVTSVPIGRPIANTQIYILDEERRPVPIGTRGELYIGGVQVGDGYFGKPELTADKFVPDVFSGVPGARLYRSGDVGTFAEDGTIVFGGRIDSQVKIDGNRVELGEIETLLRLQPDVRDAAVVLRGDERGDPHLVGYVVTGDREGSSERIRTSLAVHLPAYMLPKIVRIAELPLTPNGKLDHRALPDREASEDAAAPEAHANLLYHELTDMWEKHFGISPIGIRDNFFDLGGRSIAAARLTGAISERFGRRVAMDRFFEGPTIVDVAKLLLEPQDGEVSQVLSLNATGRLVPLFFVDGDMDGGGYYVRELARRLGKDRPLHALHMPGTNGTTVPETVEEMAATYLDMIKAIRPHGPYLLGGYCNGTLLAHEIARLMQARNDRVLMLIYIESVGSNARLTKFADAVDTLLRICFFDKYQRQAARRRIGFVATRLRETASSGSNLLVRRWRALTAKAPSDFDQATDEPLEIVAWRRRAAEYVPHKFYGMIHVLMAAETLAEPATGTPQWSAAAGRVTVEAIPGGHQTCVTRHVEWMADAVKRRLPSL